MKKYIKLNEAFEFIRNGVSIKQRDGAGGYPITRIETIANGYVDSSRMGYADIQELEKYEDYILKKGDILMSHINSEKHLGKSGLYVDDTNEVIHGMNLLGLRCKKDILLPEYAFYYFNSKLFKRQIPRITKKSVNQASFSVTDLKQLMIFTLSINEQQKIATILDKAQSLIDKRKEQIEACDELVKSLFYEMFGDPVTNDKGWQCDEFLKGIKDIKYGTSTPPEFCKCGIPFIRATNIKNGRITENDMKYISEEEASKIEKCKLQEGDLLIVRSGANTGDNTFTSKQYVGSYGGYDIIVKLNERLHWYYVNALLNSVYREVFVDPLTRRAGQPHLNSQQIQGLVIMYPNWELQLKFAAQVEKIEHQKQLLEQSLKELENNFNSLMQRAFKGELF